MATRFTKADITFHYDRQKLPAVNVKIYAGRGDFPFAHIHRDHGPAAAGFTQAWIDEHLTDRERDQWWEDACSQGLEQLQEDTNAEEIFGRDITLFQEGRSGGWVVVYREDTIYGGKVERAPLFTAEDVERWDAIAVARWGKFVRVARETVADVPYQYLSLIYLNVYEPWYTDQTENEPARAILRQAQIHVRNAIGADREGYVCAQGAITVLCHAVAHLGEGGQ